MSLPHNASVSIASRLDPLGPRALNPQPLPPKAVEFKRPDPLGPRALNPQPLPPRERFTAQALFSMSRQEAVVAPARSIPPSTSALAHFVQALRGWFGG